MEELDRSRDPDGSEHSRQLAMFLGDLACRADDAPYIARGLVRIWSSPPLSLRPFGDQFGALRARLEEGHKDPVKCPGVIGLTEADWRAVEAIKPVQSSPQP